MLGDGDRPKRPKKAQNQKEEAGINEVTAIGVTKFGARQFAQSGCEIAPGIGIGNWIERKLKALPNRPGKEERNHSPVADRPERGIAWAAGLIACELRDHFRNSVNAEVQTNLENHRFTRGKDQGRM